MDTAKIINGYKEDVKSFLANMIKYPSIVNQETELINYIQNFFAEEGYEFEKHSIPFALSYDRQFTKYPQFRGFNNRDNLVLKIPGTGDGRSLIINAHMDVVPAGEWKDAFNPRIDGDIVYGRGAVDDKGQIAVIYALLRFLKETGYKNKGDIIIELVIDEEVGGNGTLALLREGIKADGAIVLECADMEIHPANRGVLWFEADIKGKPVHMGKKHEGVSAVDKGIEFINLLYEYEKELRKNKHPLFKKHKYPAQVNIGKFNAGSFPSMVPDWCKIEGGIGFLPDKNLETIRSDIANILNNKASDWLKNNIKIEYNALHNDAYEISVEHPLVKTLSESFKSAKYNTDINGWIVSCDARLFKTVGDMPVVVTGAGKLELAHSDNEHVDVNEILKMAEILFEFIQRW